MSQQEILIWLEGKDWVTSDEILRNISVERKSMNCNLMSLVNHKEIQKKKNPLTKNGYLYKI